MRTTSDLMDVPGATSIQNPVSKNISCIVYADDYTLMYNYTWRQPTLFDYYLTLYDISAYKGSLEINFL